MQYLQCLALLSGGEGQPSLNVLQAVLLHQALQTLEVGLTQEVRDCLDCRPGALLEVVDLEAWVKVRLDDPVDEEGVPQGSVFLARSFTFEQTL